MARTLACAAVTMIAACQEERADPTPTKPAARTEPCGASGVVARLEGGKYEVVLQKGSAEQLYTVKERSGHVVVACASAKRLREKHPEVYQSIGPLIRTLEAPDYGYPASTPSIPPSQEVKDRVRALGYIEDK